MYLLIPHVFTVSCCVMGCMLHTSIVIWCYVLPCIPRKIRFLIVSCCVIGCILNLSIYISFIIVSFYGMSCMLHLSIDIWCVNGAMLCHRLHVASIYWHMMCSLYNVVSWAACCIYLLTSDVFVVQCCGIGCMLHLSSDIWCVRCAMLCDTLHVASIYWYIMC